MSEERDRNRAAAEQLATSLEPLLDGWRVDLGTDAAGERYDWVDLVRGDGARVRLTVGGFRAEGRVTLRGCWPRYRNGNGYSGGKSHAITCDASRPPAAIAREIARRLLPAYLPAYEEARRWVAEHEEHADEAHAVAARIAAVVGGELAESKSRPGEQVRIRREPRAVYRLHVSPAYDGVDGLKPTRVSFEVHDLDPETAAQVLALIHDAEKRQEAAEEAPQARIEVPAAPIRVAPEPESEPEAEEAPAQLRIGAL